LNATPCANWQRLCDSWSRESGLQGGRFKNEINEPKSAQFAANSLTGQATKWTLNQRVPGSSPGAPTKGKSLFSKTFAQNRFSCDALWSRPHGHYCATFLFLYLHPFDTARGSDGLGRLRARRRIGYSGEQTDNPFCPSPRRVPFAAEPDHIVRVGVRLAPPPHDFQLQTAITYDFVRSVVANAELSCPLFYHRGFRFSSGRLREP